MATERADQEVERSADGQPPVEMGLGFGAQGLGV